jgi:hypothetical protein
LKTFAPLSSASISLALISALGAGISLAACSGNDRAFESEATGGASSTGGDNPGGDSNTGGGGGGDATGGNDGSGGGAGGDVAEPECSEADPCESEEGTCIEAHCVEGACVESNVAEGSLCDGGSCNASGQCIQDTCSTGVKDGAETDIDCGGPCEPCADTLGCSTAGDCVSGACTNQKCAESDCDDGIKNGTETDVDCGGTCSQKCGLGGTCQFATDCAIAAGDLAESVRCVEATCVSTKPPEGYRYWQDFHTSRRINNPSSCSATDDICLHGNGPAYQMYGIDATGAARGLKPGFLDQAGVIGSSGEFDGNLCITRNSTNLSLPDQAALTVMAWVNDGKTAGSWQSALVFATRYGAALDSNASAQRFLASLTTDQKTLAYQNAAATGQVPGGSWHHVAEVYSNAGGKMIQYVDGVAVNSVDITGNLTSGNQNTFIGCAGAGKQMFKGLLDEVVIYTKALTAAEVADYVRRTAP